MTDGEKPLTRLTIRGIGPRVAAEIRRIAKEQGVSLDRAAQMLLERGAGIEPQKKPAPKTIGHDLDHLFGTWTDEEATAFLESIRSCEQVDEDLWK